MKKTRKMGSKKPLAGGRSETRPRRGPFLGPKITKNHVFFNKIS